MELLKTTGFDALAEAVTVLLNTAMVAERSDYLGAAPYEHSTQRLGYANGYKGELLKIRLGTLPLKVPQTRDGAFYPQSLEKGLRSERALLLAIAEMWVQGVSTRRVKRIVEELCGVELSVNDAHEGLQAARQAVFPSVPWQHCQFHLQQNAGHYVSKLSLRAPVAADIRSIFNAPDRAEAEHLLNRFQRHSEKSAPNPGRPVRTACTP